jgi:hypothetical protein
LEVVGLDWVVQSFGELFRFAEGRQRVDDSPTTNQPATLGT